jgi:hypothetical protein
MCCQIHPNSHPIQYLIPIFGWVRCLPVVTYIAHVPSYSTLRTPHLVGWKFTHQSGLFTSSDVEPTGLFLLKFDISLLQYHIFSVFYNIYIYKLYNYILLHMIIS